MDNEKTPENPHVSPTRIDDMHRGMTLRDYFAGQALVALGNNAAEFRVIARDCYAMADAMLTARER